MSLLGVRRLIVLITIVGVLFSAVNTVVDSGARKDRIEADLTDTSTRIMRDIERRLGEAVLAGQNLTGILERSWQTSSEYRVLWPSYVGSLPGETTAIYLAAVQPADLNTFLDAQRVTDPSFQPVLLNNNPPSSGHIFLVGSADASQPIGADLSTIPGAEDVFTEVPVGGVRARGADLRTPGSSPAGQVQLIFATSTIRPDGGRSDIWNVVQIDVETIVDRSLSRQGRGYGATASIDINETAFSSGLPPDRAFTTRTNSVDIDGLFTVEVSTRSDGSMFPAESGLALLIRNLGLTAALALFVGLAGSAIVFAQRADRGERDARHDEMTGLPNRRWLVEQLDHDPVGCALLFCDLDRFKVVNDSAGHAAGDELLICVANRLASVLDGRGTVVRFGGDEFIVLLADAADPESRACRIADEIVDAMRDPLTIAAGSYRTSMSIGIATADDGDARSAELIRAADVALGYAKSGGRNCWVLYDRDMREAELDRLQLETELQAALDDEDFDVYFQPIVGADREVVSYEALVRWHRDGQLISPAAFLPIVDEIGRMGELGTIVLCKALGIFHHVIDDETTTLHVNVDASQLLDRSFPSTVMSVVSHHGFDPGRLILELTEGEWLGSSLEVDVVLDELDRFGIGFAIDDFGSGYSSTGRVLRVPGLREIKIDRSVVAQAMDNRTQALIAGIVETAKRLDVCLVAEGVERAEEFAILRRAGIPHFQGYLFGYPAPLTAAVTTVGSNDEHAGIAGPAEPDDSSQWAA